MRRVFVDSWFLIALIDRTDSHYSVVRRLDRRFPAANLVTTDGVLMEFLAFFAGDSHLRQVAAKMTRRAFREYLVLPADRSLFLRALQRYELRPDKEYSLVDCLSMIVMEDFGIQHVLTNDHHFEQAGFLVVNQ
jgi:predicted nucleic acid-binding protein